MPRAARILPGGLTLKEEAFCQSYIQSGNAEDAYRASYKTANMNPNTISNESNVLLRKAHICKRLAELRDLSSRVAVYGLNEAMGEAKKAFDLAIKTNSPAAMVSAVTLRAKLAGILVEKREVTTSVKEVPDDELDRRIREVAAQAGVAITPVGEGSPVKH